MTPKFKQAIQDVNDCFESLRKHGGHPKQHLVREGTRSYYVNCKGSNCERCEVERLLLEKYGYT